MQWTLCGLIIFPSIINYLSSFQDRVFKREWGYLAALGFALLTGFSFFWDAPIELIFVKFSDALSFGVRLDVLSGIISTTVMFIGTTIMKFSVTYLLDDPKKRQFHKNIATTLTFVLFMLNSTNLLMFWLAWLGTSFYLHKLLLHFSEREGARRAAREKFWVSRVGDVFILLASGIMLKAFGTLDFLVLTEKSHSLSQSINDGTLPLVAALLLVLGAMTKSAQFPFHFWLPKTMETPTPVSALMHAGIINAGGFLIIRMGSFLNHIPLALNLLAIVGGFTAVYASIVMLAQTSIKKSLAYSTISQMGFMMLQCGLGAFSIAVVHIIGHAFYKAYSFLGSGTATDYGKLSRYIKKPDAEVLLQSTLLVGFLGVALTFFIGPFVGYPIEKPGAVILLLVLGLSSAQIFLSYNNKIDALRTISILLISYFTFYQLIEWLLKDSILTTVTNESAFQEILYGVIGLALILLYAIQNSLNKISKTKLGQKLYVKSLNGGFLG